jgi:hypothetical protein
MGVLEIFALSLCVRVVVHGPLHNIVAYSVSIVFVVQSCDLGLKCAVYLLIPRHEDVTKFSLEILSVEDALTETFGLDNILRLFAFKHNYLFIHA